jgi:hypothetical protein
MTLLSEALSLHTLLFVRILQALLLNASLLLATHVELHGEALATHLAISLDAKFFYLIG